MGSKNATKMDVRRSIKNNLNLNSKSKLKDPFFILNDAQRSQSAKIWQQMSINFFYNLLYQEKLCFKCFADYSIKDERRLTDNIGTYFKDCKNFTDFGDCKDCKDCKDLKDLKDCQSKAMIRKIIQNFSETAYISCWYRSDNLTDIVFKEYAKGSVGVAVGTKIPILINALADHIEYRDELFYGDAVYLSDMRYREKALTDPADLLTPMFIKSENHNDDKEFRIVYVKNSNYEPNTRFSSAAMTVRKRDTPLYLEIGKPSQLIQCVAVKREDICTLKLTEYLLNQFFRPKKVDFDEKSVDGFTILKICK